MTMLRRTGWLKGFASQHHTATVAAADADGELLHGGKDEHALGTIEQVLRDVVGDAQSLDERAILFRLH